MQSNSRAGEDPELLVPNSSVTHLAAAVIERLVQCPLAHVALNAQRLRNGGKEDVVEQRNT